MRSIFFISCFFLFVEIQAQVSLDVHILVTGKIKSSKDSSDIAGVSIQYEKLPYFDDMGIGKSSEIGSFEFHLIQGNKYNFSFKKVGFEPYSVEFEPTDQGSGKHATVLYLNPVPEPEAEPEPELITLEHLIFSRGSDQIAPSSYSSLDELVKWLEDRPSMIIQLEGHTDFAGNAQANMNLSEARVQSVKQYLQKRGIDKNRVLTKAFGGTQPLSEDRSDDAKERNRRVEVRVIKR